MRVLHCHILPGVDDGARDLCESLAMFEAAKAIGVTSIITTMLSAFWVVRSL